MKAEEKAEREARRGEQVAAFMKRGGAARLSAEYGPDLPLAKVNPEMVEFWQARERSPSSLETWAKIMELRLLDEKPGSRGFQTQLWNYRLIIGLIAQRLETVMEEEDEAEEQIVGTIYFIQTGAYVKIGFTTNLASRRAGLATSSPHEQILLHHHAGTMADERAYHKRFGAYHHRLEWFRHEGELADYIKSLVEAASG